MEEESASMSWGKSLIEMPLFTIKDIEKHRVNSGKTPEVAIIKTLERGRKFKEERYISADTVFTKFDCDGFYVKALCKASMKKEKRNVSVKLNKRSGDVDSAKCSCPAGKSGYCNHVMALLFELADYSLNQLTVVPDEISCTSRLCQWGIPGETSTKTPVMTTTIQKSANKKGISSTLFDPRRAENTNTFQSRILTLQENLGNIDKKIGFASCIPQKKNAAMVRNTPFGKFDLNSPLSYHLNPIPFGVEVVTNINCIDNCFRSVEEFVNVPLLIIDNESNVVPDWKLTDDEKDYLKTITVTAETCTMVECDTRKKHDSKFWMYCQKRKIVTSTVHKILIRKRNFESLLPLFLPSGQSSQSLTKDAIKHQQQYEPIAKELYENILIFQLNRDVDVRETGCVIQPELPWLVALPYGLISDRSKEGYSHGIVSIKCPYRKRHSNKKELLASFCVTNENGQLALIKDHPDGYYSEVQFEMGLSDASFCDFVVYTFSCMVIVRIDFDELFFTNVILKLNTFYKDFLLPKIISLMPLSEEEELSS